MEVSYRSDGTITQYGVGLGALDGQTITEISTVEAEKLLEPGTKTLNPDGTLTVTPPDPNAPDPAKAAQEAQVAAQMQAAQALIATSSNQQQADAMTAFMRTLGLPL